MWKILDGIRRALRSITGISTPIFGIQWERRKSSEGPDSTSSFPVPLRLLFFIWSYPSGDGNASSWAVKESHVLRGRLAEAKEQPGLGSAIISTQLALKAFGDAANSRIDKCIRWAIAHTQSEPPHLIQAEKFDQTTSKISLVSDFRHTLAFAIILARTRRQFGYLIPYLEITLQSQCSDGGWPPGDGITISEVVTVLYAVELLSLCQHEERLPFEIRQEAGRARDNGIQWLKRNVDKDGLWSSGVLTEYRWDNLIMTSWVLQRLTPIIDIAIEGWGDCIKRAFDSMVRLALAPSTWQGTEEYQRYRVEARIGSGVAIALRSINLNEPSAEMGQLYLDGWRERAEKWVRSLSDMDLDLATALYLVDVLIPDNELRDLGNQVLSTNENVMMRSQ